MKKYIVIGLIVLVGGFLLLKPLINSGGTELKEDPVKFTFKDNLAVGLNDKTTLEFEVKEEVASAEILFNGVVIGTWKSPKGKITCILNAFEYGVGAKNLTLKSIGLDGTVFKDARMVRVLSDIIPEELNIIIAKKYPHNTESFTQGLEFYNGKLYEGTGDPNSIGGTLVAEVDMNTGEHIRKMGLQAGFFGEGITILNDVLYQITWKNGKCYKYDINADLNLLGEFSFAGEGWGLCNDGKSLIMSDGTERIVFRNPETFEIEKTLEVSNHQGPIGYLNELEYVNGKIYANVWTTSLIVSIDPENGKVLEQIDATDFVNLARGKGEVLNGIAFNEATSQFFLTGKYWDKLYAVKFIESNNP